MKARTIALILLLVTAITLTAQTAPPSQKVAPATTQAKPAAPSPFAKPAPAVKPAAAKPAAPAPAKTATAPVSKAAQPAAKAAQPAAKAAKPVAKAAKPAKVAAKPAAAKPAKPAAAKVKQPTTTVAKAKPSRGKRDPFVNPIVRSEGTVACTNGKKCLAIDSIVLKGIVKYQAGMIAVVESSARRLSYFLRENDPVFNGYVVKITRDSVVFRENVMDALGRQSTREVVKKVVAPVV